MSAASSLHPPTPRSFNMPLPLEADQSNRSRIAARAFVSATANPQRSALRNSGRLMSPTTATAALTASGSTQRQRRPRTQHQLQLDAMSAAAGADAAAQQSAHAVAASARPHAHGQQRGSAHSAAAAVATAGHPTASGGGNNGSTPTATVAELLLAASGGPSASPTRGIGRGDGRGRVSFSTTAEDDAAMLNALSIALHAEDSYAAPPHTNGAMRSRRQSRIGAAVTTAAAAPLVMSTAHHGRVPALPPALLQSLVRSNMRHVGLSARLKTRAQVRELREAQLDCGGAAAGLGAGASAGENELARQQKLQQAARAAFPAPHAAAAGSRSASRSRSRSPRRRRPRSAEEEKQSHLSAPSLRSPRLRSHQGRGGGGLGARSRTARGPAAVLKELERELGLPLELHTGGAAAAGRAIPASTPAASPQSQQQLAPVRAADPPPFTLAALNRPPAGPGGAGAGPAPGDDASASAQGHPQTVSAPFSPAVMARSPTSARSQALRSRLLLGSFAPAII